MSSEEASLPRKITAMLNSRFSMKQGLNPPSNVLNTRLQHLQAVICDLYYHSSLCYTFAHKLSAFVRKATSCTKVEQKICLAISYYSQPNVFAPTNFYQYLSLFLKRNTGEKLLSCSL